MITFYYGSGSPYSWRIWLALEHKQIPYDQKVVSFANKDLEKPEFAALNPRRKVPVIVDDGFTMYESAVIVEYLEDRYPHSGRALFSSDVKQRAVARRLIREVDQYLAPIVETLVAEIFFKERSQWNEDVIRASRKDFLAELAFWERHTATDPASAWPVRAKMTRIRPNAGGEHRRQASYDEMGVGPARQGATT